MSADFYLRYYVGHKGKFGHEFLEFEFRPDGSYFICHIFCALPSAYMCVTKCSRPLSHILCSSFSIWSVCNQVFSSLTSVDLCVTKCSRPLSHILCSSFSIWSVCNQVFSSLTSVDLCVTNCSRPLSHILCSSFSWSVCNQAFSSLITYAVPWLQLICV